jgi:phenylpropionate dioxygenase-like ring-hydroxylating dioxygenase large terminal subunit
VGESLIVVRGGDGLIRVLSNVCRHRGNLIASGAGNGRRFSCGYHAWTYADDGTLLAAPLMDRVEGFCKADFGLPSFKTELWQNFIFVNLDGNADALAPRLSGLVPHIQNYHHEERHHLFAAEDLWHTNWKCLTENFMEGYHLSVTHRKTLHPITPTALCEKVPGDRFFTAYRSHFDPAWPERGPYHPDLTPAERRYSLLFCVFPSFVVSYAPNFTLYMCLRPASVDDVAIRWGIAGHAAGPGRPETKAYVELCKSFNAEDRAKLETLQRGLKTRYLSSGRLAPADVEGTIWDFYHFMADSFDEAYAGSKDDTGRRQMFSSRARSSAP